MKAYKRLLTAALLTVFTGCDSNEEEPVHARAEGLELVMNGQTVVQYRNGKVTGSVAASTGEESDHVTVHFLDADGDRIDDSDLEEEHVLEVTTADASVATIDQHAGEPWEFHVLGVQPGSTTLTVRLMHDDHADFTSKAIPVQVTDVNTPIP